MVVLNVFLKNVDIRHVLVTNMFLVSLRQLILGPLKYTIIADVSYYTQQKIDDILHPKRKQLAKLALVVDHYQANAATLEDN